MSSNQRLPVHQMLLLLVHVSWSGVAWCHQKRCTTLKYPVYCRFQGMMGIESHEIRYCNFGSSNLTITVFWLAHSIKNVEISSFQCSLCWNIKGIMSSDTDPLHSVPKVKETYLFISVECVRTYTFVISFVYIYPCVFVYMYKKSLVFYMCLLSRLCFNHCNVKTFYNELKSAPKIALQRGFCLGP